MRYSALGFDLVIAPPMRRPADGVSPVLLSVGGLVGKEVNLDEFLHTLVDRVAALMQADRGTLYLVDPARGELFSRAAHLPEISQIRLKMGQGVAGHVAQFGEPVVFPDPAGTRSFFADIDKLTGYTTHSLLAVPLRDRDETIFGVLQVVNRRGADRFTDEDQTRLVELARELSAALEATSLYDELRRAKEQPQAPVGYFFNKIIGDSAPMRSIYRLIQKASGTEATVLVRGESGCGKELIARAVHVNSGRRSKPFIKVDCAALPASLIENELFGHEKGAFTGADQRQEGKFEVAHGGTVFIDELGELPLSVQGKLLRVLQDREFERVGGTQTVRVDVRIVAATNRDLVKMVAEGRFREDLYYRIKVVELVLPPLRERGADDIERLARHFLATASKKHRLETPRLSSSAVHNLTTYRWPGNVRELENCIESAVVLSDGEILPEHLPLPSADRVPSGNADPLLAASNQNSATDNGSLLSLAEMERRYILHALEKHRGNRTATAKALEIGRNTLQRKLKEYGFAEE